MLASKTLKDGIITDEEFILIIDKVDHYQQTEKDICIRACKKFSKVTFDEVTLIQRRRDEARASIFF